MAVIHLAAPRPRPFGWSRPLRRASGLIYDPASGAKLGAPAPLVLTLMNLLPLLWALGMGFFRYRADRPHTPPRFLGLGNYADLMGDADIWERLRNTGVLIASFGTVSRQDRRMHHVRPAAIAGRNLKL